MIALPQQTVDPRLDPAAVLLFYYVYIAEGVRKAARLLNTSASNISKAMARLQAQLGYALYVPGHRWQPTAEGEQFFHATAKPVGELLRAPTWTARHRPRTQLRVGASHYVLDAYVVQLEAEMQRQFPDVQFTYRSGTRRELEAMLGDRQLELAIVTVDEPTPGIQFKPLRELPLVLLAPERLTQEEVLRQLAGEGERLGLACPPPDDPVARRFFALPGNTRAGWPVTHHMDEVSLVPSVVAGGRAMGPCPRDARLIQRPGVKAWPLACAPVTIGAAWCGQLKPAVQAMLEVMAQVARAWNDRTGEEVPAKTDVAPKPEVAPPSNRRTRKRTSSKEGAQAAG